MHVSSRANQRDARPCRIAPFLILRHQYREAAANTIAPLAGARGTAAATQKRDVGSAALVFSRRHSASRVSVNPESRDSGFDAEPVIGPRFARTRWHRPGMTIDNDQLAAAAGR
jgi:hypothetical protein